jgi:peroxiredoxin
MRQLLAVLFLVTFYSIGYAQEKAINKLNIGDPAPDFKLPGIDGKSHSLEEYSQYPLFVVIFTCNHCPTAQAYEDKIISLVERYQPKGVGFVAISPNDPEAVSLSELG